MMTRRTPIRSWARRGYALLAATLPGSLRRRFGSELLDTFDRELDLAIEDAGAMGGIRFAVQAAIDVVRTGTRERYRRRRHGSGSASGGAPVPPWRFLVGLGHDLRAAVRHFRARPALSLTVVLILALGLASSVAVFSYVNAFSQAPPGVRTDRLMEVLAVDDATTAQLLSFPDFTDYAQMTARSFEVMAAVRSSSAASVKHATAAEVVLLEAVSGAYFDVFGVEAELGRVLQPSDDVPGAPDAAVISNGWWREVFNSDPGVLGQTLYLNGRPHTIVGVLPPTFLGSMASFRPRVWIPFEAYRARYTDWDAYAKGRDRPAVRVYGRLREGVSADTAASDLAVAAASLDAAYPAEHQRRLRLVRATWIDPGAYESEARTIDVMAVAVLALMLLSAANVANLLLSGMSGRRQEFATRAALGASGSRLFRQLLAEHLLLSAAAGAVALAVAQPLGTRLGSYFARPSVWGGTVARDVAVDPAVWLFALAVSLALGVVTGGWPAWRASRERFTSVMARFPQRGGRWRGLRMPDARSVLVVVQVSLAVVLLVSALLVVRTLEAAGRIDPGFDYRPLVSATVSVSSTDIPADERGPYYRDLSEMLTAEPWVRSATVADTAPLSGHAGVAIQFDGRNEPDRVIVTRILPGYFDTLAMAVRDGRDFRRADSATAPPVAIVSQSLVSRYFPKSDPVGRIIQWPVDDGTRGVLIVGVVDDARVTSLLRPVEPVIYVPATQYPHSTTGALLVATTIDPSVSVPMLERWLRDHESHIAIVNVQPYVDVVRGSLYVQRMNAELFSVLAGVGLVLATIGVFSVMALTVGQRTREIGIRMAIGAQPGGISRLILAEASVPIVIGVACGGLTALLGTRLMKSLLLGVEPTDPASTVGGLVLVAATALLAAYLPARRAATVDPVDALRRDGD